jgi:hypothetical protein
LRAGEQAIDEKTAIIIRRAGAGVGRRIQKTIGEIVDDRASFATFLICRSRARSCPDRAEEADFWGSPAAARRRPMPLFTDIARVWGHKFTQARNENRVRVAGRPLTGVRDAALRIAAGGYYPKSNVCAAANYGEPEGSSSSPPSQCVTGFCRWANTIAETSPSSEAETRAGQVNRAPRH